ncbi:unnamed protein product [Owenia fusiformis]|uniref:Uncharacterized protein n=1 Tax=Owenia fusiformis TaxID=6347 RepID=A0A8J1U666_OWEFU|nr:unnamed protein product [Owenia fusiformis]
MDEQKNHAIKPRIRTVSGHVDGAIVSFHDIQYTVNVRAGPCCCGKVTEKKILQNINGLFKPGMNAILGPTGSGKTSLLDVLAARKDPNGLQGTVLVNGQLQPSNFKLMSGYVVQDDVVMGTLSVRENFHFSAALRLPSSVSYEERKERVEEIIVELGLTKCADTKVGTEFIRGVSGGERKRTNIGMELITAPNVLFLDEPTTGLDASTANAVMSLLQKLSRKGRTIIFSIHQPRFSIFKQFDNLALLSLGEMVYHGPSNEALDYFESIGYECEAHNNPPDFFLDIINGDSTAVAGQGINPIGETAFAEEITGTNLTTNYYSDHSNYGSHTNNGYHHDKAEMEAHFRAKLDMTDEEANVGVEKTLNLAENLAQQFADSTWNQKLHEELAPIYKEFQSMNVVGTAMGQGGEYATGFLTQLGIVSVRALKNIWRNPQTSIMQLFVMLFFGVIVGIIYFQLDLSLTSGIQNRVGAFFFIAMNMMFGNLSAVELFIKERAIFVHESASGFYRVSAYFLAKLLCDIIPMRLLPVIGFSVVTYWMIGFVPAADKFFFFILNLFLITLSASGLAFFLSSSVSVFAIANLLIALCFVFMMVFSGLLVNLTSIAEWLQWIKYLSIIRYGLSALQINELKDLTFCSTNAFNVTQCSNGTDYLDSQGVAYSTPWDLWVNEVAMGSMAVIFLSLTYVQLRRINKLK